MRLFDTHTHLNDEAFDEDRSELIGQIKDKDITVLNLGYDLKGCEVAVDIARNFDNCYCAVGIHPENIEDWTDDAIEKIKGWLNYEKTIVLGEIGLDYHWEPFDREKQLDVFSYQLELAKTLSKPVSVHSRDAVQDTFDCMKAHLGEAGGILHSFNQSKEMMKRYLDMNVYFGISGPVTFKNSKNLQELIPYIPMDRLVIETDAPYLAPHPNRGKRNSSLYLELIAQKIADLKGISVEEVADVSYQNALKIFKLN